MHDLEYLTRYQALDLVPHRFVSTLFSFIQTVLFKQEKLQEAFRFRRVELMLCPWA